MSHKVHYLVYEVDAGYTTPVATLEFKHQADNMVAQGNECGYTYEVMPIPHFEDGQRPVKVTQYTVVSTVHLDKERASGWYVTSNPPEIDEYKSWQHSQYQDIIEVDRDRLDDDIRPCRYWAYEESGTDKEALLSRVNKWYAHTTAEAQKVLAEKVGETRRGNKT